MEKGQPEICAPGDFGEVPWNGLRVNAAALPQTLPVTLWNGGDGVGKPGLELRQRADQPRMKSILPARGVVNAAKPDDVSPDADP